MIRFARSNALHTRQATSTSGDERQPRSTKGRGRGAASILILLLGCSSKPAPAVPAAQSASTEPQTDPREEHLTELQQLTFGGENAEAYWAFDSSQLIFQAHQGAQNCDQIYTLTPRLGTDWPEHTAAPPTLISRGGGATTCAYFMPDGQHVLYASTQAAGPACPPKPDRSQGYVWPLYEAFDIYQAKRDGSDPIRLTDSPGYDAEGTVCGVDGSIVFTSVRDGDLELYRMQADGSGVVRLTHTPGYDGGAFFNADCSKIVWRASRPEGEALEDYRRLLAEGLVRPGNLELYIGNADGSEPYQITYLNAAAFAPFWHPNGQRILFSTNFNDPRGREFDIWAVGADGTDLEQITFSPGFDGFPMFSPDGRWLAFSSNRGGRPGTYDTNVFVTRWREAGSQSRLETAADRVQRDIRWLASPERQGRGVGTAGLEQAGHYLERRFQEIGLTPLGPDASYVQPFEVTTEVQVGAATELSFDGAPVSQTDFQPLAYSAEGKIAAPLALAGYGIVDAALGIDDYKGVVAKGNIVVVRRFVPEQAAFEDEAVKRRLGDLQYKAWVAREHGAKALIVVDAPLAPSGSAKDWTAPDEAVFPSLHSESYGDAGLPVVIVRRTGFAPTLARLERRQRVLAAMAIDLEAKKEPAFNVLGRLTASVSPETAGSIVIGAHYDHLGMGGFGSLAPDTTAPHLGADDNASGVATMLEIAYELKQQPNLKQHVVFMAFSGEERGLLGSTHLTHEPPAGLALEGVRAMLNLDMVGRLRENQLTVLGVKTADEWPELVQQACNAARIECHASGDGYGPSDQTAFYSAGIPVLHFFTGAHADYHKPSDTPERINAAGAGQIAQLVTSLTRDVARHLAHPEMRLTYRQIAPAEPAGDVRSFNASLGSIPDYAGPASGEGVLLAGVRPGSAAEQAGMQRGDVLVHLGSREIKSVHDLMYALNAHKPGEEVTAIVLRDGKPVELGVTFQKSRRSGR